MCERANCNTGIVSHIQTIGRGYIIFLVFLAFQRFIVETIISRMASVKRSREMWIIDIQIYLRYEVRSRSYVRRSFNFILRRIQISVIIRVAIAIIFPSFRR